MNDRRVHPRGAKSELVNDKVMSAPTQPAFQGDVISVVFTATTELNRRVTRPRPRARCAGPDVQ